MDVIISLAFAIVAEGAYLWDTHFDNSIVERIAGALITIHKTL